MYSKPPTTFSEVISPCSPEVQEIAIWLRGMLLEEFPELDENIYGGSKVANALYSVGGTDRVALGLQPGAGCMKLFLHDPEHLPSTDFKLEGKGKHMRHIKVSSVLDDRVDELLALARVPVSRRS